MKTKIKYILLLPQFILLSSWGYSQVAQKDSVQHQKATINSGAYYILPKANNSVPVSSNDSVIQNPYMIPKPVQKK